LRWKYLSEIGNRSRWLFWETLIVFLGVLIAFAANDYWSDRNDRELELQYLKRLHADLKADAEWVTNYAQRAIPAKMVALDTIAPVVRNERPVPDDMEKFLFNVGLAGLGGIAPRYFVTSTTFDDLKSTGNLRLIRDTELRSKINGYYVDFGNDHARVVARTTLYAEFVHSILPAEKREINDMEAMQKFGVQRAIARIQTEEFRDLLNQEYNFAYFLQRMYPAFASRANDLADQLSAHIQQLEMQ
jgi:hypothetical protein